VASFREPRPIHRRHDVWVTIVRTLAGIIVRRYGAVQFYPYVHNDSSYLCSVIIAALRHAAAADAAAADDDDGDD